MLQILYILLASITVRKLQANTRYQKKSEKPNINKNTIILKRAGAPY